MFETLEKYSKEQKNRKFTIRSEIWWYGDCNFYLVRKIFYIPPLVGKRRTMEELLTIDQETFYGIAPMFKFIGEFRVISATNSVTYTIMEFENKYTCRQMIEYLL